MVDHFLLQIHLTLRAAGGGGSCLVKLCRQFAAVWAAAAAVAASSSDEADLVSCRSAIAAAAACAAATEAAVFADCFLLSLAILSMASCLAFHLSMRDWVRLPDLWSSVSSSLALEAELPDLCWARSDCGIAGLLIRDSSICAAAAAEAANQKDKVKHTLSN